MNIFSMLPVVAAVLPLCLCAAELNDTVPAVAERGVDLGEVIVVANRPVFKSASDRIIYLTNNDPFALGLNGMRLLGRMPRVSVANDEVRVAGKSSVRYIVDGHLLEMSPEAIVSRLKNLQSSDIEKIELLTTPPAKYAAESNAAYISITTRDESLGTRGNLWGSGTFREHFSHQLGGSVSHTTRRIDLSADASWQDSRGINDLERTYAFGDHAVVSDRSNHFANRSFGANGMFRYKFNRALSAGVIVNFNAIRMKSEIRDMTVENGVTSLSENNSPGRPDNALTLTAFGDWTLDGRGKALSLTYNYFNRETRSLSDVATLVGSAESVRLRDEGRNRYRINSVKLDALLPFVWGKMGAGAAYTAISNNSGLKLSTPADGEWVADALQSNNFDYGERTAAVYASAERNFSKTLFCRIGLRYEHTDVSGRQDRGTRRGKSYGRLFPSVNASCNFPNAGRISLSYSMGITRPGFRELNPFRYYTTVSDYFSGNPDLDPAVTHNAEVNYSFKGVYAVLYTSHMPDGIGYLTRFGADGSRHTLPENCVTTNKSGLYASYDRALFGWWSLKLGGELFHTYAKSRVEDFRDAVDRCWSGKVELNTSWMLNRQKTLILNFRFSHYFPWSDRMTRYSSISLIGCDLRYSLLGRRLNLSLSVNDPFGWNITESRTRYNGYEVKVRNDIHSHAVTFRLSWAFGRDKVKSVYRDTKDRDSSRI